jgi:glyoxylase-like metal-dependent hydrolase (beta-lactamase superfamily II)
VSGLLQLDVFVAAYKPITGLIAPMGEGEATWPATSVSLISGERDAVLIDALITEEEAGRVVDWIRATGKNLTTIYITHGHGDHFFGLNTILAAFPDARAVTAAAVVPEARRQVIRTRSGPPPRPSSSRDRARRRERADTRPDPVGCEC